MLPVTPLQKHPGHRGGIIALAVLVATVAVVVSTRRPNAPVAGEVAKPASAVPRAKTVPALRTVAVTSTTPLAIVAQRDLPSQLAATGTVSFDEERTAHVITPVAGWLEKRRPKAVGTTIRAGETLGVVYSPEVYLTTLQLLSEVRDFKSQDALDKPRIKLLRFGMRRDMVAAIEKSLQPQDELPLIARVTGTVVAERGSNGQLVDPGTELFTITDPQYGWIYVDLPDGDVARANGPARITLDRVVMTVPFDYVARRAEGGKRTVRFALHARAIKIGASAAIALPLAPAHGPGVPAGAIVRDGERTFVYVVHGSSADPREITLGAASGDDVIVTAGLAIGDTVIAHR